MRASAFRACASVGVERFMKMLWTDVALAQGGGDIDPSRMPYARIWFHRF